MTAPAVLRPWPGWPHLRRWAPWALAVLVLALLARQAHTVDWPRVLHSLAQQPPGRLAAAALLAAASYALFASYDLIGRRETGHGLPVVRTLRIGALCYAFNLNFGSLVGALAIKLRLYLHAGLPLGTVGRVIALGIATNWLGFLLVGGTALALGPALLPPAWAVPGWAPRLAGVLMLLAAASYGAACARPGRSTLRWRDYAFTLPRAGTALWQAGVAAANWSLMGAIVWLLLGGAVGYPSVLGVLLLGAIAGVLTHVPAGLGVLEAVFLACLGSRVPATELLAALLAYRAVYYLVPLVLASAAYAWLEARQR